jgi:nitrate reductase delta subunit
VGLDLLAKALDHEKSFYRHVIEAVRAMLPPPQPGDIAAAIRLAQSGPPVEQVVLEPFGLIQPAAENPRQTRGIDTTGGRR